MGILYSQCPIERFRLRVLAGPDKGLERLSDGAEFRIGTAEENHLVLTDRTVSRHHAVVTATPQGFVLRDVGSTNGTTLAGYRVEKAWLKPGAIVGVGGTQLQFDEVGEEILQPLSLEQRFGDVLGRSVGMRRMFAMMPSIAQSDCTVLIEGETGTGKGLLAEAIHMQSPRATGPFVVVDFGAIPPTLMESELFGHTRGAFSGAHTSRPGAFEAAQGGTVFLDEIGELAHPLQTKILRVLDRRRVQRLGSHEQIPLDVRVIAATNRDLRREVDHGSFRADLFYRLNVVGLKVPPLRERRDDIGLLIQHFWEQTQPRGSDIEPPAELIESLSRRDWPGNVRELRNAVERAVLLGNHILDDSDADLRFATVQVARDSVSLAGAQDDFDPSLPFRTAKEAIVSRWEKKYLSELLKRSGGNVSRAARDARMDRNHLRDLIRRYNVLSADPGDE